MNKIIEAIKFMYKAHENQFRKDGITPYSNHPMQVYSLLKDCHFEIDNKYNLENIYITALLHDVLEENKKIKPSDIEEKFGKQIVNYILKLTFTKDDNNYFFSKSNYFKDITNSNYAVLFVKIADRICNSIEFSYYKDTKQYAYRYFRKADIIFSEFYNYYIKNKSRNNNLAVFDLFDRIIETGEDLK